MRQLANMLAWGAEQIDNRSTQIRASSCRKLYLSHEVRSGTVRNMKSPQKKFFLFLFYVEFSWGLPIAPWWPPSFSLMSDTSWPSRSLVGPKVSTCQMFLISGMCTVSGRFSAFMFVRVTYFYHISTSYVPRVFVESRRTSVFSIIRGKQHSRARTVRKDWGIQLKKLQRGTESLAGERHDAATRTADSSIVTFCHCSNTSAHSLKPKPNLNPWKKR